MTTTMNKVSPYNIRWTVKIKTSSQSTKRNDSICVLPRWDKAHNDDGNLASQVNFLNHGAFAKHTYFKIYIFVICELVANMHPCFLDLHMPFQDSTTSVVSHLSASSLPIDD